MVWKMEVLTIYQWAFTFLGTVYEKSHKFSITHTRTDFLDFHVKKNNQKSIFFVVKIKAEKKHYQG